MGKTNVRSTLYRKVSAHLKRNDAVTHYKGLFERHTVWYEGKKYSCLICSTNFGNNDGKYFHVVFQDGAALWASLDEFVTPPKMSSMINAVFGSNWTFDNARFDKLDAKFGPHDVDACCEEDGSNAQLPVFWHDALVKQWRNLNVWCNPPFEKIHAFLTHFLKEQAAAPLTTQATFILPIWTTASWWRLTSHFELVEIIPAGSKIFKSDRRAHLVWDGPTRWDVGVFRSRHLHTTFSEQFPSINYVREFVMSTLMDVSKIKIPITVPEALNSPQKTEWRQALDAEKDALLRKGVYTKCVLPKGKTAVKSKVVFKIKQKKIGTEWILDRYKASWVACGYSQRYGVDFSETFAPVVNITCIRVMLCIIVQLGMKMFQFDVSNAFLYGYLKE